MDEQIESEQVVIVEGLSPKELDFCQRFTEIGGETFNEKASSAEAAGYAEKSARITATKLMKKPAIRQQIRNCNTANMIRNNITIDSVLTSIEHDKQMARKDRQWGIAKDCAIAQGKWLAMFTDRQLIEDPQRQRELSEKEIAECEAIAKIRLQQMKTEPLNEGGKEAALVVAKAQLDDTETENDNQGDKNG